MCPYIAPGGCLCHHIPLGYTIYPQDTPYGPTYPPDAPYGSIYPLDAPYCPKPSPAPPPRAVLGSCPRKQPPPGPLSRSQCCTPTAQGLIPHGTAGCSQVGKLRHGGTSQPEGHPLRDPLSLPREEPHHPPPPKTCTAAVPEPLSSLLCPWILLEKNLYFLRFISPQRPSHRASVALQPPRMGTSTSIPRPRQDGGANPHHRCSLAGSPQKPGACASLPTTSPTPRDGVKHLPGALFHPHGGICDGEGLGGAHVLGSRTKPP